MTSKGTSDIKYDITQCFIMSWLQNELGFFEGEFEY